MVRVYTMMRAVQFVLFVEVTAARVRCASTRQTRGAQLTRVHIVRTRGSRRTLGSTRLRST